MVAMKGTFDQVFTETYLKAVDDKVSMKEWFGSMQREFAYFIGEEDLKVMASFDVKKTETADLVVLQRVMGSSLIARCYFTQAATTVTFLTFVKTIDAQIEVVENLNFKAEDCVNFRKVMSIEVSRLYGAGTLSYERQETSLSFCTVACRVNLADLNDHWFWRFGARVKTIGVQTRALPTFPWENALWPKGTMQGVPETIVLDGLLLAKHASFRRSMLEDIEKKKCVTLVEMQAVAVANLSSYKTLDRTCDLELSFLADHAKRLLMDASHKGIVQIFPDHSNDIALNAVLL